MSLIHLHDKSYERLYLVSTDDLLSAVKRNKQVVALRYRLEAKLSDMESSPTHKPPPCRRHGGAS